MRAAVLLIKAGVGLKQFSTAVKSGALTTLIYGEGGGSISSLFRMRKGRGGAAWRCEIGVKAL